MADTTVVLRQQARDQYDILASEQHPADANALYDAWMEDVIFPEGTSQFAGLRDLAVASGAELRFARGSRANAIRELILLAAPFPTGEGQPAPHGHQFATIMGWYNVTVDDQDEPSNPPPPPPPSLAEQVALLKEQVATLKNQVDHQHDEDDEQLRGGRDVSIKENIADEPSLCE